MYSETGLKMGVGKLKAYVNEKATAYFDTTSDHQRKQATSLEQIARETINQTYHEDDPSVAEWFRGLVPSSAGVAEYMSELFPSAQWVRRYNVHWLGGDLVAGITVGLVVVPQAMAYATLARLPPAFGLYTTFTGACVYWIFGTSKDIVIGTTAVGSLLVGGVIGKIEAEHPGKFKPEEIAHTVSFLAGAVLFLLGVLRLGWVIEFIPYVPISAFVTAASITIISTQLPTLLGIAGINTRTSPYKVYVSTLKNLSATQLDAAVGITCLILLHVIRTTCAKMELRQPAKKRVWSMLSSLRLTFAILLYTFISFLVHRKTPKGEEKFRIVGHIDKGFRHAGVPTIDTELIGLVATELPAIVIILVVEHIAIAKSFGRMFGYTIVPSQEMIAQGVSNILSPFVGGYVCTGSFGASAVLSKAAVRTPLAGLFSAMVLVLALYALTAVFYFIPNAALAGLIIHCTANLITPPRSLVKFWHFSPFELFIWVCGVVIAIFTDLEIAIYVTVGLSFAMLLIRMARNPGRFRGAVGVTRVVRNRHEPDTLVYCPSSALTLQTHTEETRQVYLPYDAKDIHNPDVKVEPAYPGVFIYRFAENFNYINQAYHIDYLTTYIKTHTRRTEDNDGVRPADRLWCETPPCKNILEEKSNLPTLKAIVLDFSAVNIIDITSLEGLIELRSTLDQYATPGLVEWHFAGVHNRWTRRALAYAGFGLPASNTLDDLGNWCPAYTVATGLSAPQDAQRAPKDLQRNAQPTAMELPSAASHSQAHKPDESVRANKQADTDTNASRFALCPVYATDRPLFHIDLHDAVDAAVRDAKMQHQRRLSGIAASGARTHRSGTASPV